MIDYDPANILMVDDQPGKLLSYEVILAQLGENLIKARSAREALDQLWAMISLSFSWRKVCRKSTDSSWQI